MSRIMRDHKGNFGIQSDGLRRHATRPEYRHVVGPHPYGVAEVWLLQVFDT